MKFPEVKSYREFLRTYGDGQSTDEIFSKKRASAETSYHKAKSAIRQENWAVAAELLGSLNREALRRTYRDIETLYLEACEKAGIVPYPETPSPDPESTEASAASPAPPTASPEKPTPAPTPDASVNPFLVTEDDQP